MNIWTVYASPADFPGLFVARRWEVDRPTADVLTAPTLAQLRAQLPLGLHRLARQPDDDSVIVECWI